MGHAFTRIALAALGISLFLLFACSGGGADEAGKSAESSKEAATAAADTAAAEGGKVVTTASGLKYEIIRPGTGKSPMLGDRVTVNYRGTLTDGKEFDSSYKRGKPATFPVAGVIKGWTEALQLMKEGAKWRLTIPPDLAYGSRGAGNVIGPNETLIFDVELLKVN